MHNFKTRLFAVTISLVTACTNLPPLHFLELNITNTESVSTTPIPSIETGTHTARINHISVNQTGTILATGSDDKTARVWNITTGQLLKTLRPPIGQEADSGKIYAVAISPDGEYVAVGGTTFDPHNQYRIFIFDSATGSVKHVLKNMPGEVTYLAWSHSNKMLAATFSKGGLRIFDSSNWNEIYIDSRPTERGVSIDFSLTNLIATLSQDNLLRLYKPDGNTYKHERSKTIDLENEGTPRYARFSPNGQYIAVSRFASSDTLTVFDTETLSIIPGLIDFSIASEYQNGVTTWSKDNHTLFSAINLESTKPSNSYVISNNEISAAKYTATAMPIPGITDALTLPNSDIIFSTEDATWGIFKPSAYTKQVQINQILDFRNSTNDQRIFKRQIPIKIGTLTINNVHSKQSTTFKNVAIQDSEDAVNISACRDKNTYNISKCYATSLRVNTSGKKIEIFHTLQNPTTHSTQTSVLCFDLSKFKLNQNSCSDTSQLPFTDQTPIIDWFGTATPRYKNINLTIDRNEISRSLFISHESIFLGTNSSLYSFAINGQPRWRQSLPGTAWSINIDDQSKFIIVAAGDGSIRWYADKNTYAEEVLALYIHPDGKRWIAWTPQGFFDSSGPDAEQLFGFHVNRGPDQAGEFVRASQLRERFYNPELIAHRLDADGDARLARVVERRGAISVVLQNAERLKLTRRSPATVQSADGEVRLEFALDRPLQAGEKLVVRVDGKEVDARDADPSTGKQFIPLALPPLAPGLHRVETAARNTQQVDSEWIETRVEVAQRTLRRGLHVIAVGVSRYYDSAFDLRYAASDANAFADALAARARAPVFPRGLVTRKVLIDTQASRNAILQAFADLASSPDLQSEDTVVVYLAGHGLSRDGDYRFIPHELRITDTAAVTRQALDGDTLRSLLRKLPADTLIVLDTCDAGSALPGARGEDAFTTKEQLAHTIQLSGRAFLTATGPKTLAMEGYREHGYFTYALLEGLEKTDLYEHGQLTVDRLWAYAYDRLGELTAARGLRQVPMRDAQNRTFPIAGPRL